MRIGIPVPRMTTWMLRTPCWIDVYVAGFIVAWLFLVLGNESMPKKKRLDNFFLLLLALVWPITVIIGLGHLLRGRKFYEGDC